MKTTRDAQDTVQRPSIPSWFGILENAITIRTLRADHFYVMCTYMKPSSPDETPLSSYPSCSFMGQYGLCVLKLTSTMHQPRVTPNDFKQLITDNIDPQMAEWGTCYPEEQTE